MRTFPEIRWRGDITYGELHLRGEIEGCTYNFETADVENLRTMYDLCEAEAKNALTRGLMMPAHDYVLKCSHIFNVLDARGAVGVTERARYFLRMRDIARQVTDLYAKQREEEGYPFQGKFAIASADIAPLPDPTQPAGDGPLDFVFEIGCEELPVHDLDGALDQLKVVIPEKLGQARLGYQALDVQGTPRRLVVSIAGLDARQEDRQVEARGPAVGIAYDGEGQPTRAAIGFSRGKGVDVEDLQQREIGGRDYVVAVTLDKGRNAGAVLAEMLPEVVASLRFPRSMRWNASRVAHSRPLRWFVALLGDVVVPFEYAGVRSGNVTRGIRSQNSPDLVIASASEYAGVIKAAGILLRAAERHASILEQAHALAAEVGGEVADDPDLVQEVTNLVEFPLAIRGAFDREYLRLPESVLTAVMRKHQRYLSVSKDGRMLPYFVTIANGGGLDMDVVRFGNQEVLRARFADAAYFYRADTKKSLGEFTPRLSSLMFQERLGTVLDKVQRLERLVPDLGELLELDEADMITARRAAALCKSDLATQLVVELTSLQGQMGGHYAELAGESPEVAQAIEEHYLPRSMGDRLPEGIAGALIGLADRLDTLVGLFAVGIRPRGAADPWGLRRSALGIVQLLLGKGISLALPEALSLAAETLPIDMDGDALRDVHDYILGRFRGFLLDRGHPYDMVDAVLNERGYDPYLALETLRAFEPWVARDDWQEILDSYARCVRITRDQTFACPVQVERFVEPSERDLYQACQDARRRIAERHTIDTFLETVVQMRPLIERFFEDVLVMDKDAVLRNNRIGLLQSVASLAEGIVDLTVMEGF